MTEHEFHFTFKFSTSTPLEDVADRLFDLGVDDCTVSQFGHVAVVDVDRRVVNWDSTMCLLMNQIREAAEDFELVRLGLQVTPTT